MRNPFKTYQEYVKKTPRVAFDKSHRNNLTIPMGLLVPDLVLDVVTGDSMSLDASFAFNINPMVFPVQTPLRISQYFFYVPWRLTWVSYEDYRYNNKPDLVHPYLKRPSSWFKTGSLADYMGIPTTIPVSDSFPLCFELLGARRHVDTEGLHVYQSNSSVSSGGASNVVASVAQSFSNAGAVGARAEIRATTTFVNSTAAFAPSAIKSEYVPRIIKDQFVQEAYHRDFVFPGFVIPSISSYVSDHVEGDSQVEVILYCATAIVSSTTPLFCFAIPHNSMSSAHTLNHPAPHPLTNAVECAYTYDPATHRLMISIPQVQVDALNSFFSNPDGSPSGTLSYDLCFFLRDDKIYADNSFFFCGNAVVQCNIYTPVDISERGLYNPFYETSLHPAALRINALPFRAYEMVCNTYFRNDRVDPFILNGEVQYNNFLTTKADGADETDYKLWNRNWELDRFTSCLKTPQQGTAPIVGADLRTITFESDGQQYRFAYVTEADGHTVAGGEFETEDVPGNVKRAAMDLVTAGFNIESLREANAMQRYLERNIRRGLRYKDQVKSHTGVDLDAALLDEPEFLGGFSHYVDVRSVTCSSPSGAVPLADIAGQASAFRKASHEIRKFFREDGVVLGLVCITPEPVYSQSLEKFYLRSSPLDYYNTEFSHLGMQPVPYAEVSPIQMCAEIAAGGERTYQSVFGYNRPNYDMVSAIDECHGFMRTTDRDFVMMRQFDGVPDLSGDFIKVKGSHLNDVFSVTDENGHIAKGQVAFQIFMKRPVPAVGEPRLE